MSKCAESGRRRSRQGRGGRRAMCLGLRMHTFNNRRFCYRSWSWYCRLLLLLLFKRSRISHAVGFRKFPPIWLKPWWIASSVHSHRSCSVAYASRIQTGMKLRPRRGYARWWEVSFFTSCREARGVKACWRARSMWRMHASCKWCCKSWGFEPRRGAHRRRWV